MSTPQKSEDQGPRLHSNPGTSEPPVLFEDLTAGLLWPTLIKAPAMAFSPPRLLLGVMGAFLFVVIGAIHSYLFAGESTDQAAPAQHSAAGFEAVLSGIFSLNPSSMLGSLFAALEHQITQISQTPSTSIAYLAPMILVSGIFGHAITRSASIQYAHGRQSDTTQSLSASLLAIRQIALTTLGPLLICAVLSGFVMLIGLTLGLPIVNIFGAVLYLLGLIISALIVCILTLHTLTLPLSISALAIEGTDGFDALQRAYAYIIARPIRLAIYALILTITGTLIVTIVATLAGWSIQMADGLVSTLTNDAGRRVLAGSEDMGATEPLAFRIITLARSALELIVAGYVLSLVFCSSTMAYLCIRRVCDGQDITEVWDPPK